MKHTPIWEAKQIGVGGVNNDVPVYDVMTYLGMRVVTVAGIEHARLIAAAPELLEVLESVEHYFETFRPLDHPMLEIHEIVRAAISRATAKG